MKSLPIEPENTMIFPIIRTDLIVPALASFSRFGGWNSHRVIVIDQTENGMQDLVRMGMAHAHLRVYRNLGFAKAANTGIRLADTKYVTICNDDVLFFDDRYWSGIKKIFDRVKDAVGVSPMCPRMTFGIKGVSRKNPQHIAGIDSREACQAPGVFDKLKKESPFQGLINGCALWCVTFDRLRLLDKVGLFEEKFFPGGGEDYDLLGRCSKTGLKIYATHESWAWHDWGQSKDEKGHDGMPQISQRKNWNRLGDLWPDGFDCWGRKGDRIPEVHVEPL